MTQNFAKVTVYQLFPRAFTREGTLAAASAHLADIASLGVDYVYLCPVFFVGRRHGQKLLERTADCFRF